MALAEIKKLPLPLAPVDGRLLLGEPAGAADSLVIENNGRLWLSRPVVELNYGAGALVGDDATLAEAHFRWQAIEGLKGPSLCFQQHAVAQEKSRAICMCAACGNILPAASV
jgi:hypothetical protein